MTDDRIAMRLLPIALFVFFSLQTGLACTGAQSGPGESPPSPSTSALPRAPAPSASAPGGGPTAQTASESTTEPEKPRPTLPDPTWIAQGQTPAGLVIDGKLEEWKGPAAIGWLVLERDRITIGGKLGGAHDTVFVGLRIGSALGAGPRMFVDDRFWPDPDCLFVPEASKKSCEASIEAQKSELSRLRAATLRTYRIDANGVTAGGAPLSGASFALQKGLITTFEVQIPATEMPALASIDVQKVGVVVRETEPTAQMVEDVTLPHPVTTGGHTAALARAILPLLIVEETPHALAAVFDPKAATPTLSVITVPAPRTKRNPNQKPARTDIALSPKVEATAGDLEVLRYDVLSVPAIATRKAGQYVDSFALPRHIGPKFGRAVARGKVIDVAYESAYTPPDSGGIQAVIIGIARAAETGQLNTTFLHEEAAFKGASQRVFAADLSSITLSGTMMSSFSTGHLKRTWLYDPQNGEYTEQDD